MIEELKLYHKYTKSLQEAYYVKEYVPGQTDTFVGIRVPDCRKMAKKFFKMGIEMDEITKLMTNEIHEYRLIALFILTHMYNKDKTYDGRKKIVEYYLDHLKFIDNWDLVDSSAYKIIGRWAYETEEYDLLTKLAADDDLWIKRIGIVSLYYLIKREELVIPIMIINSCLKDKRDLIKKACGWMMRLIYDKNPALLTSYIYENYDRISRVTLIYAIEHYPKEQRQVIIDYKHAHKGIL